MKLNSTLQHPYFLLMLAPLIWGGNAVVGRLATGEIAPFTLTALRWALTLVILLPFVLPSIKRDWVEIRRHWFLLLSFGIFGFAAFNMLLYNALHYTTAVNVTLIQAAVPMIILSLSWLLFREHLKALQIIGLLAAFIGVALIITQGNIRQLRHFSANKGDIMMLIAALLYALYSMGLRYKPNISWLSFIAVSAVGALLTTLPFVGYEITTQHIVIKWSTQSALLILYTALFASLVAQIAYAQGVSAIGANRAGLALNLVPVFGALLAVLILGESIHWYHFTALALVLGGIALSEYSNKIR